MTIKFTNNAVGSLASTIDTDDTSITVGGGEGNLFPSLTGSDYFMATLVDSLGNFEIVKVTARTVNTMTIVRAQEGTTAKSFDAGSKVEHRLTAGVLAEMSQLPGDNTFSGANVFTGSVTFDRGSDGGEYPFKAGTGDTLGLPFHFNGILTWRVEVNQTAYAIKRHDSSGVLVDTPISIDWATGAVTLAAPLPIGSGGTGQTTALAAFNAIKQSATTALAGVVEKAEVSEVRAATADKYISADLIESVSAPVALTDASPVAVNWDAGINFTLTATANRQIDNPTNGQPGTWRTILVQGNDGTARTITFGNQFLGELPEITDCTSTVWYLLSIYCVSTTHFVVAAKVARS